MALQAAVGRRAFSETYEDTWGEYEETTTDFTSFNYDGDPIFHKARNLYVNDNECSGSAQPTQSEILTLEATGSHKGRLTPMLAGIFFSSLCDTYTATAGDSSTYTHGCKFKSSTIPSIKSRNMLELAGGVVRQYSGVVFPSFEMSVEKEQFVNATMGVVGYYATKTSSLTVANMETYKNAETYMNFGDVSFARGTYDQSTDVFSSVDSFTTKVRSLTVKCEATMDDNYAYQLGNTTKTRNGALAVDTKWTITGQLLINALDDATDDWLTDYLAQTEWAVNIPIVGEIAGGAVPYSITLDFPKCRCKQVDLGKDNGLLVRNIELTVMGTPNGTTAFARIVNLLPTFQGTI
jgi:hypothetical protein